ncbi:AraC family transcriptional regulator [Modicisalibacter radicis]|uniref:AraC family transcriptional regulator n=1 Tax=Halomonas sp. EAR18 TaxID=2518972 RepID=UPI00109D7D3D|nr:AraC family transcriptional regulator [Halomonas sp. EAR18]
MVDPVTEVVSLLQPGAPFSKIVNGAGAWRVRHPFLGRPFYCVILEGACHFVPQEGDSLTLGAGDFVLTPEAFAFTMSSLEPLQPGAPDTSPVEFMTGRYRLGAPNGPPDFVALVGHCEFGSPDAALLVSLLPQLVHVRGQPRLATLVELVREESRAQRPARDVVLSRLLEVLLVEAFRSAPETGTAPGLVNGLADERLSIAIRLMHEKPARRWTVAQLAQQAALSRSAFFERFNRVVGVAPMEYLLAWRMAMAKAMLRDPQSSVVEIADRVGYRSASTFSVAFSRYTGLPPRQYAKEASRIRESGALA